MIGLNKIRLNQATITEAVQEYLDKRWIESEGVVTQVKEVGDGIGPYVFEVSLSTTTKGDK